MRPWTWVRRILALAVAVIFSLGLFAMPAMAKSRSFSAPKSFSSGKRSFSVPKTSVPKVTSPPRSFSTPKPTAPSTQAPSTRSFTSPAPPPPSTGSKSFTPSDSQSYSSGSRSYTDQSRSFANQRPSASSPLGSPAPVPSYDPKMTRYPTARPVVVIGPTMYDPTWYHDYYWGRPWYWRIWHRPYYSATGGWALSWTGVIIGLVVLWILLGWLSAINAKRRRNR